MIREVILEAKGRDEWTSVVAGRQANIRVTNCRPYGRHGMLEFVMINSQEPVKGMLKAIRMHPNVGKTDLVRTNDHRASGMIVTKRSPFCRTIAAMGGFCTSCFYSGASAGQDIWQIAFMSDASLNKLLRELGKHGIKGAIRQVEHMRGNNLLTFTQEKALKLAETKGYYSLPRMVGVRELAEILGMAPSTLDEVLRRAEGKIVSSYTRERK